MKNIFETPRQVRLLLDSLLDRKTNKEFKSICAKMAIIEERKIAFEKEFFINTSRETINNALDLIDRFGHPDEINKSKELRTKYESGVRLTFDDIASIVVMYKSNCQKTYNKDETDE